METRAEPSLMNAPTLEEPSPAGMPEVAQVHKDRFSRPQHPALGVRIRPVFDDFHLLWMDGDYEYPRHQHDNYEVIFIEKGPYLCEVNGVELSLSHGQILVIKPGDWHQDHLRDGQRHYVLHFRLVGAEAGAPATPVFNKVVLPAQQICREDFTRDVWFLSEMRREATEAAVYAGAVQDSLLEAFFWHIVRGLPPEALSQALRQLPEVEVRREEIASLFMQYVSRKPNVGDLAAALKISPRQLVNRCHDLFGESPARLLLRFKLRIADELLRYRGLRVQEVSNELGFANPYHFSRVYRRLRGYAPTLATGRLASRTNRLEKADIAIAGGDIGGPKRSERRF
jgi:AraC-like DNA-binding protein